MAGETLKIVETPLKRNCACRRILDQLASEARQLAAEYDTEDDDFEE